MPKIQKKEKIVNDIPFKKTIKKNIVRTTSVNDLTDEFSDASAFLIAQDILEGKMGKNKKEKLKKKILKIDIFSVLEIDVFLNMIKNKFIR